MAPPRNTAAQTWTCVWLVEPAQARGETHSAKTMPASHCSAHQVREQPIGAPVDLLLVRAKERVGGLGLGRHRRRRRCAPA